MLPKSFRWWTSVIVATSIDETSSLDRGVVLRAGSLPRLPTLHREMTEWPHADGG